MRAQQFSSCELQLWQFASCELQFNQSVSCELWVKNKAASWESYQSSLSVYIISSLHVKESKSNKVKCMFQLRYTPESNRKIYYDSNRNELEKQASIYANIDW